MSELNTENENPAPGDELPGSEFCRNCGAGLQGEYCGHCGQHDRSVIRFFPSLVLEAFEGLFAFDSKTYRSLWYLFSRPAFLTREYLAGRRVRYLAPLRLFIIFILMFLFTISLQMFLESIGIDIDQDVPEFAETDRAAAEAELEAAINELADGLSSGGAADASDAGRNVELTADMNEFQSGVSELISNLHIPFLSEQNNAQFVELLQERAANNIDSIAEDPSDFLTGMLEYMPVLMLLMVPLLAAIQKLAFIGSGRYYVEHLVLTLHNHSFLFLTFSLLFVLDVIAWTGFSLLPTLANTLSTILSLWVIVYLFLSLRLFFQQGYFVTGAKFFFISIVYGALLVSGILLFMLVGFFIY